jgi:predicted DNA helicase
LVEAHSDIQLARKLVREAHSLRDKAGKWTRGKPQPGARQQMREEARDLIQDARRLEAQVVKHLLDSADIVCSTTTAIDSEILGQRTFDLAVIDEACQSTEPGCWIPLQRSERVILAGDHCQLPPTVVSRDAEREGFGLSMLERLIALSHADCHRRLDIQYRMHEQIMRFSSDEFYDGGLTADASVQGHLLSMIPGVESNELTDWPLEFIDSAGASYDEELEPDGESRRNPQEAALVARQVERLCASGLSPADIAVITPYAAQARLLREQLSNAWPDLEIDTVDGFQGREKEAVVVSLVRSNSDCEIGFLADTRRMNVALTRARRKLIVIGDSATIGSHEFYQRLLAHFERSQAYRTVWEYL